MRHVVAHFDRDLHRAGLGDHAGEAAADGAGLPAWCVLWWRLEHAVGIWVMAPVLKDRVRESNDVGA